MSGTPPGCERCQERRPAVPQLDLSRRRPLRRLRRRLGLGSRWHPLPLDDGPALVDGLLLLLCLRLRLLALGVRGTPDVVSLVRASIRFCY